MLGLFRTELEQQTALLTSNLLSIEKLGSSTDLLQSLMRAAHSIKGAARIANRRTIVRVAHAMEDCFVLAQHGTVSLTATDVDVLLKAVDFLSADVAGDPNTRQEDVLAMQMATHLLNLEKITSRTGADRIAGLSRTSGGQPCVDSAPPHGTLKPDERVVRVTAASLDQLLGLAGELLIHTRWMKPFANALSATHGQCAETLKCLDRLQGLLARENLQPQTTAELELLSDLLTTCGTSLGRNLQELSNHDSRYSIVSHRLYVQLLQARMRPFSDICAGFPRMVRDLGRSLRKEVRLEIEGESIQIDREILERLESVICHLLRNAVDHGCEPPHTRRAAGKPPECLIHLAVEQRDNMLCVTVADDGPGIDSGILREAVQRWNPAASPSACDSDLLRHLFVPGFTLRKEVTDISGRGVGLDIVYNTIKRLRGEVRAHNEPGKGMRFTIFVPLAVSVLQAEVAEISETLYAFPANMVCDILELRRAEIITDAEVLLLRKEASKIILLDGRDVFEDGRLKEPLRPAAALSISDGRVLLIRFGHAVCGLMVDAHLGRIPLILQPGSKRNSSRTALIEDGREVLVPDITHVSQAIAPLLGEISSR